MKNENIETGRVRSGRRYEYINLPKSDKDKIMACLYDLGLSKEDREVRTVDSENLEVRLPKGRLTEFQKLFDELKDRED